MSLLILAADGQAVAARQVVIDQDDVRASAIEQRRQVLGLLGGAHGNEPRFASECALEAQTHRGMIVDDRDADHVGSSRQITMGREPRRTRSRDTDPSKPARSEPKPRFEAGWV